MYYVYYALLQMGFVHLTLPSMPAYVGTLNTESINIDSSGTTPSSWRISCYPGRSVSNGTQRWTAEKAAGQKANKLFIFANKKDQGKIYRNMLSVWYFFFFRKHIMKFRECHLVASYKLPIILQPSPNGVLWSTDLKRNMSGTCISNIPSLFKIETKQQILGL